VIAFREAGDAGAHADDLAGAFVPSTAGTAMGMVPFIPERSE